MSLRSLCGQAFTTKAFLLLSLSPRPLESANLGNPSNRRALRSGKSSTRLLSHFATWPPSLLFEAPGTTVWMSADYGWQFCAGSGLAAAPHSKVNIPVRRFPTTKARLPCSVVRSLAASPNLVSSSFAERFSHNLDAIIGPVGVPYQRLARSIRRASFQSAHGSRVAVSLR